MKKIFWSNQKLCCRIFLGISCFFWLFAFLFGIWCKRHIPDNGITQLRSVNAVYDTNCIIDYAFGKNKRDEKSKYKSFRDYRKEYVEEMTASPVILIGKATGNIIQYASCLGQEIKVEQVCRGDQSLKGKIIMVYQNDGIVKKKKGIIFMGIRNFMQEGNSYAVFLQENTYYNFEKKAIWNLQESYFAYLSIKDMENKTVKMGEKAVLSQYSAVEFFACSERLLQQIKFIKKDILDISCPKT